MKIQNKLVRYAAAPLAALAVIATATVATAREPFTSESRSHVSVWEKTV